MSVELGVEKQKKLLGPMLDSLKPILQIVGLSNKEIKSEI